MKSLLLLACLLFGSFSYAQTDSTVLTEDTTDIYVINSTNRLVQVGDRFLIEFRDLKSLKELHYIQLDSKAGVDKFFATCYRVLDQNIKIMGQHYSINRNMVSKNVVRIEHHDQAYFMLAYGTIEKMEKAFQRHFTSDESN
jgi:hypothetical protein